MPEAAAAGRHRAECLASKTTQLKLERRLRYARPIARAKATRERAPPTGGGPRELIAQPRQ
eukprot:3204542-Pyramimonas_sp.AAC.1